MKSDNQLRVLLLLRYLYKHSSEEHPVSVMDSQADRRERYITEEAEAGKLLSLEQLLERGVPFEMLGIELEESAEVSVLEQADRDLAVEQTKRLMTALSGLERDEQELIQALFFDGVLVRAYSRQLGVRLNAVQYRRDKLLKKLREKIFS